MSTQYFSQQDEKKCPIDKLLTLEELQSVIPASDVEITIALKKLNVVEINHKLRMLNQTNCLSTTRLLLDTIIENDWKIDEINLQKCIEKMEDIDVIFLKNTLNHLGTNINENNWKLNDIIVTKEIARMLFLTQTDTTKV